MLILKGVQMKLIRSFLLLAFPLYFFSCKTQQKIPNYLQNVTDTTGAGEVRFPEMIIQKNDLLSIQVYSASTRPELSDAPYNLPSSSSGASSGSASVAAPASGFLVDAVGNIEYPRIGLIHAAGLTKQALGDVIKRRINEKDSVLTDPSVIVRFQNLKITVIGEVNTQGVVSIPGERVTILEAIGLSGGITDFGLKNAVKVIRETNGKREVGTIDLSAKDIFESPYYTLVQNDVILVDPTNRKAKKADQEMVLQRVGFGLSIITAIALLYNVFK